MGHMPPRIKVKKGRPLPGYGSAPVVTITGADLSPASGTPTGGYTATAIDDVDGDISANLVWTASVDGVLGSGASPTLTFTTQGNQTLTASVTDSNGQTGQDDVAVSVGRPLGSP